MILGTIAIILSLMIGLIPSLFEIRAPMRNGIRKFNRTGIFVLILVPVVILIQAYQIIDTNNEKNRYEEHAKKDRAELIRIFINENNALRKSNEKFILNNNKSIVDPYVKGLIKYGLKFDTSRLEIQKILKDSIKTVVYNDIKPEMSYDKIDITTHLDTVFHKLEFTCQQATMYNFKVNIYCVARTNDNRLFLMGKFFPVSDKKIPLNTTTSSHLATFGAKPNALANTTRFYYFIIGQYQDNKGKIFNEDSLIAYDKQANMMIALSERELIWVRDFCAKRNLK